MYMAFSNFQQIVTFPLIDINDQISHAVTAVDHHKVMLESIKRESPVLTKLRDSFAADINYEVRYVCTQMYMH